jgi:hypothetical protein
MSAVREGYRNIDLLRLLESFSGNAIKIIETVLELHFPDTFLRDVVALEQKRRRKEDGFLSGHVRISDFELAKLHEWCQDSVAEIETKAAIWDEIGECHGQGQDLRKELVAFFSAAARQTGAMLQSTRTAPFEIN